MKRISITTLTLVCFANTYCQNIQRNDIFVYGELGAGYGTHFAAKAQLNGIFNTDNIVALCYYYTQRIAPDIPSDYHAGLFNGLPHQRLNMAGIMYGKVIYSKSCKLRYTLKGGIALGNAATPVNYNYNYPAAGVIFNFDRNYNYSYNTVFNYGLVFNPTIEFPVGRGFGFSLGIFSIVNPISSSAGIETSLLFGRLRQRNIKHDVRKIK